MKYETQSSAVMLICQVLLSALLCNDHQKETDSGVTLDSVRKFYLIPGMICGTEPYFDITCSSENTCTSPTEGIFSKTPAPPHIPIKVHFVKYFGLPSGNSSSFCGGSMDIF